jgi:hypothetical protein
MHLRWFFFLVIYLLLPIITIVNLAFVVVGASSFATPVTAARPSPTPGAATASCASAAQSQDAADCPRPTFRGP